MVFYARLLSWTRYLSKRIIRSKQIVRLSRTYLKDGATLLQKHHQYYEFAF